MLRKFPQVVQYTPTGMQGITLFCIIAGSFQFSTLAKASATLGSPGSKPSTRGAGWSSGIANWSCNTDRTPALLLNVPPKGSACYVDSQ
jgi:hypothetical protein